MEIVLEAVLLELVALLAKLALDRLIAWFHEHRAAEPEVAVVAVAS